MKKILLYLLGFVMLSGFTYTDIDKTLDEVNTFLGGGIEFKEETTFSDYDSEKDRIIFKSDESNIFLSHDGSEVQSIRFFKADQSLVIYTANYIGIKLEDDKELMALLGSDDKCNGDYVEISNDVLISIDYSFNPKNSNSDEDLYLIVLEFDPARFWLIIENKSLYKILNGCEL